MDPALSGSTIRFTQTQKIASAVQAYAKGALRIERTSMIQVVDA
jgi:hypothetical protein